MALAAYPGFRLRAAGAILACAVTFCLDWQAPASARELWYRPPAVRHVELAYRGNPSAQAWLGYLYDRGLGVPQNYETAAYWYQCAADAGEPHAQFLLGLAYNRARGVPQSYVAAYAWMNQAVAHAPRHLRAPWAQIRDSTAFKLSLAEITQAQRLTIDDLRGPPCESVFVVKGR